MSSDHQLSRTSLTELFIFSKQHLTVSPGFYLQPFDHGNDLHQGKFLFTGVIITCGPFIFLCCAWTVLVTEFICGMDQLPRVLKEITESYEYTKATTINGKTSNFSYLTHTNVFPTHRRTQSIPRFTHNFHDVRAPLGQQLQSSQCQVEQLPVLLVRLLAVQARARHHFAVAVACQLRDETDVVLPDLHHLLTQVVLR